MLENLVSVGPPIAGTPDWRSPGDKKTPVDRGSSEAADSFDGILDRKSLSQEPAKHESYRAVNRNSQNDSRSESRTESNTNSKVDEKSESTRNTKSDSRSTKQVQGEQDQNREDLRTAPQAPPGIKKVAAAKGKAMQNIMDSFESEFGIPSMRLMEAIANTNVPVEAPEDAAALVVENLNLDDDQKTKAMSMLTAFFADVKKLDNFLQKPALGIKSTEDMLWSQRVQDRVLSKQEKRNQLHHALDLLNQKFFAPTKLGNEKTVQQMAENESNLLGIDKQLVDTNSLIPVDEMNSMNLEANPNLIEQPPQGSESQKKSISKQNGNAASQMAAVGISRGIDLKKISSEMQKVAEAGPQNSALALQNITLQEVAGQEQGKKEILSKLSDSLNGKNMTPNGLENVLGQSNSVTDSIYNASQFQQSNNNSAEQDNFFGKELAKQAQNGKVATKADKKTIEAFENFMAQPQRNMDLNRSDIGKAFVATAPTLQASPEQKEMNVQQLMNQAQYLIKKGGGEVKVQMNPEGLGQIHLRVQLEGGKVNLQMAAETPEAKKTIESGLAELKSSLAAHKLSVDNVKVDVVNSSSSDVATQNQSRNQSDMSNPNQRDNTRQFWNHFQEQFGNRSYRDNLYDVNNEKGYGSRKRDPLQPLSDASSVEARKVSGKGDGLNLVA